MAERNHDKIEFVLIIREKYKTFRKAIEINQNCRNT